MVAREETTDLGTCLVSLFCTQTLLLISFVTLLMGDTLFDSFLFLFFFDFSSLLHTHSFSQATLDVTSTHTLSQGQVLNASATLGKLLSIG